MLKNKVGQHVYKFNHKIGEVSVSYQWKELRWIISRVITLLDNLIHHMNLINKLANTKIMMYLTHTITC